MTITKLHPSGAIEISDTINGYLVTRRYFGYTQRGAKMMFKQETKSKL